MCEKLAKLFDYNMDGSKKEQAREEAKPPQKEEAPAEPVREEWRWIDDRTFFQKYTPLNIAREIKKRMVGV
jgi:hypothetical protein